MNDISGAVDNKLLLYADDSAILVSDKNVSNIESLLQKELEVISEWLIDNRLSLHLRKQSLFCLDPNPALDISCKRNVLEEAKVL